MNPPSGKPPALADWILTRLAPRHVRDDVLGDLHEEYRRFALLERHAFHARLWYWRQVIGTLLQYRVARGRGRATYLAGPLTRRDTHMQYRQKMTTVFGDLVADARFALRAFRKSAGFALAAVLILGIGIGAVTLMFSTMNSVVLRPLPFETPERLVWLGATNPQNQVQSISAENYLDYRDQVDAFESVGARLVFRPPAVLTGGAEPERVVSNYVTATLFPTLGVTAHLGRGFIAADEQPGAANVVVIGYGLWQRRFGGSATAVGTALIIDGDPHEVVGVMPSEFDYPGGVDLWFPADMAAGYSRGRGNNNFFIVGRLRAGVSIEQLQVEVDVVASRLQDAYPETNDGWGARAILLHERYFANTRQVFMILMGLVGLVLLIACANVASLSMARATTRGREFAVRRALGAARGRLMRQLLTEHLLLAGVGGGVGLLLSSFGVKIVRAFGPANLRRLDTVDIDGTVLLVTAGVTIAAGLLFGVMPTLRGTKFSLAGRLRTGGGGTSRQSSNRARSTLVVTQVALSLMLLAASGLLLRSFMKLQQVDPGFRTSNVLIAELQLPGGRYSTPEQIARGWVEVTEQIAALPGVTEVGAIDQVPIRRGGTYNSLYAEGREPASQTDYVPTQRRIVTEGFLESLAIPLKAGRGFESADRRGAPFVTVINEVLAERLWPGEDPIGRFLVWRPVRLQVVGVVGDIHDLGPASTPGPMFYVPSNQMPRGMATMRFMIHTTGDPMALAPRLRLAVLDVDKDIPISGIDTMEGRISTFLAQPRFRTVLVGLFAVVAVILSTLGVYTTLAYFVRERTYELAVRIAVGATAANILVLVVRNGMTLVGLGSVVGLAGAYAGGRLLQRFLFEVSATDPFTFAGVTAGMLVVALFACLVPARRAVRVDPRTALAAE